MNGSFAGKISMVADMEQDPVSTLRELILAQGGGISAIKAKGDPDFSKIATSADTGLYAAEDEYGTSYYYRGEKTLLNNNLIWGGFQWKIVRINGDGSIRLIYNGTEAQFTTNGTVNDTGEDTQIGEYAWSLYPYYDDAKYVGYMYGGLNGVASTQRDGLVSSAATYNETSSNAKIQLEAWYQENLSGKLFEDKIVDNIFCNDRQLRSEVGGDATGPGYGISDTKYAADQRLIKNKIPTLRCKLKNDRFTTNDTTLGNGSSTYPIGLITVDEASMAGLLYATKNTTNYLYTNQKFWTFSPMSMYADDVCGIVWFVNSDGGFYHNKSLDVPSDLRPVLNLSSKIMVTGTGSATAPFIAT